MDHNPDRALFVTANVGSLFSPSQSLLRGWLEAFFKVIRAERPGLVALHMQELGGKEYEECMSQVEQFVSLVSEEADKLNLGLGVAFLDSDFEAEEFTALGSIYLASPNVPTALWDFGAGEWRPLCPLRTDRLPASDGRLRKTRFPHSLFPQGRWSRKGSTLTRWRRGSHVFHLANLHLFHNASNLAAFKEPTKYPKSRERALKYILDWVGEADNIPLFLFGDFNFRLQANHFVKRYTGGAEERRSTESAEEVGLETDRPETDGEIEYVRKDSSDCVLRLGRKRFESEHGGKGLAARWAEYLPDDQETSAFPGLREEAITFPPSYPWSEEPSTASELMPTRPPAWCDRVLMNEAAWCLGHHSCPTPNYSSMGRDVCMGDHKPVYLSITLPENSSKSEETVVAAADPQSTDAPFFLCQYSSRDRALIQYLLSYSKGQESRSTSETPCSSQQLTVLTANGSEWNQDFVTVIRLSDGRGRPVIEDGSRFRGSPRLPSRSARTSRATPAPPRPRAASTASALRQHRNSSHEYSSLITLSGDGGEPELVFAKKRDHNPSTPTGDTKWGGGSPAVHHRHSSRPSRPLGRAESSAGMRSNKRSQTEPGLSGDTNSLAVELERRRVAVADKRPIPPWAPDWSLLRQDVSVHLRTLALLKKRRQRLI